MMYKLWRKVYHSGSMEFIPKMIKGNDSIKREH